MKKTLASLFLALALLCQSGLLTAPAAAFSDVDGGLYYAAPIAWAVENGITTGTTGDTFSPDALCTRGQIITFLWRAAGSPSPRSLESPFGDVTPDMNPDIYRAILWAGEEGIIRAENLEADRFSPSAPCRRSMAVLFLWRYAGSPESGAPAAFTDVRPEADYAPAVAWAVESGITSGTSESTFSPGETCTRGQITTFLYRCLTETGPGEKVYVPEEPISPAPEPEPREEARPTRTFTGLGDAYSLGLDGSEFVPGVRYDAEVKVEIYSPLEAGFTIRAPFPLYQACRYSVRFEDPENPGTGYVFTYCRWDEAFDDLYVWKGDEPQIYTVTDLAGNKLPFTVYHSEDDRSEGVVSWKIALQSKQPFHFNMLEGYALNCEINSNL